MRVRLDCKARPQQQCLVAVVRGGRGAGRPWCGAAVVRGGGPLRLTPRAGPTTNGPYRRCAGMRFVPAPLHIMRRGRALGGRSCFLDGGRILGSMSDILRGGSGYLFAAANVGRAKGVLGHQGSATPAAKERSIIVGLTLGSAPISVVHF